MTLETKRQLFSGTRHFIRVRSEHIHIWMFRIFSEVLPETNNNTRSLEFSGGFIALMKRHSSSQTAMYNLQSDTFKCKLRAFCTIWSSIIAFWVQDRNSKFSLETFCHHNPRLCCGMCLCVVKQRTFEQASLCFPLCISHCFFLWLLYYTVLMS